MTRGRRILFGLGALAAVALAGCGNDASRSEGFSAARSVAGSLFRGGSQEESAPDPAAFAQTVARALQLQEGPLMLVISGEEQQFSLLGEYGRNGGYRTWANNQRQALIFNGGILTGTRGLGNDLMSSQIGEVAPLIRGRRAGTAQRVYRHLDGENDEASLTLTCTVAPAGSVATTLASGATLSTVQVNETCRGAGLSVQNVYFVTGSGFIPQSRQWQGPVVGDVAIQVLRN